MWMDIPNDDSRRVRVLDTVNNADKAEKADKADKTDKAYWYCTAQLQAEQTDKTDNPPAWTPGHLGKLYAKSSVHDE
jgi:hypothetical protein